MSQDGVRNSAAEFTAIYSPTLGWCVRDGNILVCRFQTEERAALIVKAVNLHDELVEILTLMVADEDFEGLCQGIGAEPKWLKMARAVLAKAGSQ